MTMNPYLVLGLDAGAEDATIRQAYLRAVKASPPDLHPERFKAISAAYEKIKDEPSRLRYYLFNRECPGASPLDAFRHSVQLQARSQPPGFETLKDFLRSCSTL